MKIVPFTWQSRHRRNSYKLQKQFLAFSVMLLQVLKGSLQLISCITQRWFT